MDILYTDVLVIGGGLAGLRTAIGVTRRGLDTPVSYTHLRAHETGVEIADAVFS